ncbi:MAG: AAA family ATPase [Anaerolineaceae bacterium]|nr:AAA family ATPase [Anaerolineaceae bacterium]
MENKTSLNIIAFANPMLYGDFAKYFYSADNTTLKLMMQYPSFDLLTVTQFITNNNIDAIIVEPNVDNFSINDILSVRQKSEKPILIIGLAYAGTDMEKISRSGFDLYYPLPLNETTMRRMSVEILQKYNAVGSDWKKGAWASVTPQELREVVTQATGNWQKAVISVWSPKGGVGKTTVAVELASILAGIGGRNVCLLDTNQNGGHVRLRLNIRSEHSIVSVASMFAGAKNNNSDWSSMQREINEEMEKYLVPVPGSVTVNGKSNFYCIPGITTQEQARSPHLNGQNCPEFMRSLMDYLKQRFDFIVIDVGSSLNVPIHRESFKNSDTVLVVCDADAACIADTQHTVTKILAPNFPLEKFSLVLNKWKENLGISMQDVATKMGISVRGFIPDDYLGGVIKAGNTGVSYVVSNNKKTDNSVITERCMQGFANLASTFYPPVSAIWQSRATNISGADKGMISSGNKTVENMNKANKKKQGLFSGIFGKR